jgi:hypothetical protein
MALFGARRVASDRQAVRRFRPTLEAFEERRLPSLFTVTNLYNAGAGSLRKAILQANATLAADTIQFAPGLTGQIKLTTGEVSITHRVSIVGPAAGALAVSGNYASRVFTIAAGAVVTISNLNISNGRAGMGNFGGGILNNGALTLKNLAMTDNRSGAGGAVATIGGRLTVHGCKLASNSAFGGGAIGNDVASTALIRNTTITGNHGGNSAQGAGINNRGAMTIVRSTIAHNTGRGSNFLGGGIFDGGTLTILASTVAGNLSEGSAGGIWSTGSLTITHCTIADNVALGSFFGGGGISAGDADLAISSSTVTGNVDASGSPFRAGGISFVGGGSFTINNTVVAENFVTGGGPPDVRGAVGSGSGNFIGAGTTALVGITNGANGNRVGTVAAPLDPELGPLENNGGPTLTRLPRPGSPLINAGVNAVIPTGITTDQRGFRRIKFGIVDIGAVEFGATS